MYSSSNSNYIAFGKLGDYFYNNRDMDMTNMIKVSLGINLSENERNIEKKSSMRIEDEYER
ncbi:hypothetical protein DXA09_05560 [Absiella sp. AM54-8XD]|nr:hypothetical protein DXA09_05560 [Absiella sp. AM54-8XD]